MCLETINKMNNNQQSSCLFLVWMNISWLFWGALIYLTLALKIWRSDTHGSRYHPTVWNKADLCTSTAFFCELKNGIISATKISITGDVVVIFATYFRRESAGSFLVVKVTVQFPGKSTPSRFVHFVCFLVLLDLALLNWRKGWFSSSYFRQIIC